MDNSERITIIGCASPIMVVTLNIVIDLIVKSVTYMILENAN
jgi:hypothetical protein